MKTIVIKWSTDDILLKANRLDIELTELEADEILTDLERHHDAEIGINWDVIGSYIYQYQYEREEINNN